MSKLTKIVFFMVLIFSLSACQPTITIEDTYYHVVFVDEDGTTLLEEDVLQGQSATPPDEPTKEGYHFIGWDLNFDVVNQHLFITAMYEAIEVVVYYQVTFKDDVTIYDTQQVIAGQDAIAPLDPTKEGYIFLQWDKDYTNVTNHLVINAIFQLVIEPLEPIDYVQYTYDLAERTYKSMNSLSDLMDRLDYVESYFLTIYNIFYGGFRDANQIHYYEAANYRSRNVFGYEIAVDARGIVIDKGTLVDLPDGGFILSGHSNSATFLESNLQIGDVVIYQFGMALCYRDEAISKTIGLHVAINNAIAQVEASYGNLLALNYVALIERINDAIAIYNELNVTYTTPRLVEANNMLLEVSYLLVEGRAVDTRAFWHYPLRLSMFPEQSVSGVQALLDQIVYMGFNTIYINTNFNGSSIYQSVFLQQRLANSFVYGHYKDYLECFVEEAHMRGLTVIAWTNTLIVGDGSIASIYHTRGWVQKDYFGNESFNGMYYIDISHPEAQTFLASVFNELASNYQLDGIEFDFIRFPSGNLYTFTDTITNPNAIKDSGYTPTFINGFMDAFDLTGDFHTLILQSPTIRSQWIEYKRHVLNDTVEMLVDVIRSARSDILITAAVMANSNTARNVYLQDWDYWLSQGWIDILEPMIYSGDTNYVLSTLATHASVVNNRADIVVGIFPEVSGGTINTTAEQIARIQVVYPFGWSKFSSRNVFNNVALMESYHLMARHYTVRPDTHDDLIIQAYIHDLYDKVLHFYRFVDGDSDYDNLIDLLSGSIEATNYQIDILSDISHELNHIEDPIIRERLLMQWQYINTITD